MSCWRKQIVLRVPCKTCGISTYEELCAFENEHDEVLTWEPGTISTSLSCSDKGLFFDYIIRDQPVQIDPADREEDTVRPLTLMEMKRYLPRFQKLFPNFSLREMYEVHYCSYIWYDGTEAPYLY